MSQCFFATRGATDVSDDKTRILTADEMARLPVAADTDGDKTRVLSAEEAARVLARAKAAPPPKAAAAVEDREPKFIGSKIVFFCANGHKITVDRSLAGKHGQCQGMARQGCGVAFVVPVPPDFDPQPAGTTPPSEAATDEGSAPNDGVPAEAAELPGATLAFDLGAPTEPPGDPSAEVAPPAPELAFGAETSPGAADEPAAPDGGPETEAVGWGIDIDEIDHPTARLVARLWLERAHGGIVEVHLSGGSVVMPEWYEPRWSCGSHALFAAQAADGTLTLTAVAWDQIQKVVVRQVRGTPEGMFEG